MVEYFLSGAIEVWVDGAAVPLGGPKQRAALAVLLAHHGSVVSVDRLIDSIWDDAAPAKALTSLRSYVANLRRLITPGPGGPRLESRPQGYQLNLLDTDTVDLHRIDTLVVAGRTELISGNPQEAFDTLTAALALWRGDPYGDFTYREFAAPDVRRYTAVRATAVEARLDAALQQGRGRDLIPEIEAAVAQDPLQERLWGHLMVAYFQAGRQADALQAYARASSTLEHELGSGPGEGLQTLFDKIGSGGHELLGAPIIAPPEPDPPQPALFVGRRSETESVTAAVHRAATGTGGLTLVSGESGIGKTTLAQAVTTDRCSTGLQVVWATHPTGVRLPLMWTWIQVLRQLGDDLGAAGRQAVRAVAPGVVDALVPEWDGPDSTTGPATGFALIEGVVAALRALASIRPLLVVLDDLHQADAASTDTLALLAAQFPRLPVHVIGNWTFFGTDRPINPKAFARLMRSNDTVTLSLSGIDRPAAAQLIESIAETTSDMIERMWRQARGNPFYLKELARTVDSRGAEGVSEAVAGVVGRRLSALDRPARRVLGAAAVIGPEFEVAALADIIDLSVSAVQSRLRRAYETGLLDEVPTHPGAYQFSHGLVRDAVVAHQPVTDRTGVHAAIATTQAAAIATVAYEDGIAAADHAWLAGAELNSETALEIHETVIQRALGRSAYDDVSVLCEHALQISQRLPAKPEHLERQATLWLHFAGAKGILEGQASTAARAALQRAFDIGDHVKGRSFYSAVALQCLIRVGYGHIAEAQILADGLREQYRRSGDPDAGVASDFTHTMLCTLRGDFDTMIATGQHMMATFPAPETVTDPLHFLHPRVYCWMALVEALRGDIGARDEYCRLASELAESRGDAFNILAADLTRVETDAVLGVTVGTAARADEVDRRYRELGGHQWASVARMVSVWAQVMETGCGDTDAAFTAYDDYTCDGTLVMTPLFLALLADIEERSGRADTAQQLLTRAQTVAATTGECVWDEQLRERSARLSTRVDVPAIVAAQ